MDQGMSGSIIDNRDCPHPGAGVKRRDPNGWSMVDANSDPQNCMTFIIQTDSSPVEEMRTQHIRRKQEKATIHSFDRSRANLSIASGSRPY